MKIFNSGYINTEYHHLLGMVWPFRGCQVQMFVDGFGCTCQKRPREKCNHIKSVEYGILGVNTKEYAL